MWFGFWPGFFFGFGFFLLRKVGCGRGCSGWSGRSLYGLQVSGLCRFGAIISWLTLAYAYPQDPDPQETQSRAMKLLKLLRYKLSQRSHQRIESIPNRFFDSLECQQNFADDDLVNCLDLVRIAGFMHMHMDSIRFDSDIGDYNYSGHTWLRIRTWTGVPCVGILNNSDRLI